VFKQSPRKSKIVNPATNKDPRRIQHPDAYYDKDFSWRVHEKYIDCEDPKIGWSKISVTQLLMFIIKGLHSYEGMTWREIKKKPHCHAWEINQIPTEFVNRLQKRQIDIDELFQISLGNLPRVFGNRIGPTLYLIWYDPDHKFWPTEPKNS